MQPTMFYLVGMPAVGKYTIAKELAGLTGARLVDNHSIANVIFNLFDLDGIRPLPEGIFGPVGKVRQAVLDALTNLAPRELSYVFTIVLLGGDPAEAEHFHKMVEVAEQRGSLFVPVLLRCQTGELMLRAANESRVQRLSLIHIWWEPKKVGETVTEPGPSTFKRYVGGKWKVTGAEIDEEDGTTVTPGEAHMLIDHVTL